MSEEQQQSTQKHDPIVIELRLPDRGDRLLPNGTFAAIPNTSDALLDDPVRAEMEIAAAIQPSTPKQGPNWFSDIWNSPWGKWVFLGAVSAAIIGLIVGLSHHSTKLATRLPPMTPLQATQAEAQLSKQLSTGSEALKAAGYSDTTVAQARNQTQIVYGSRIALATIVPSRPKPSGLLYVTGSNGPGHYVGLDKINAHAYVGTLSASPTAGEIVENSAVVHGVETTPAK